MKFPFHLVICIIIIFIYMLLGCFNITIREKRLKVDLLYNDSDYLKDVNILGTHNSLTYVINNYYSFHGKTQRLTIREQYNMGVRFFDIRVSKEKDRFIAYHGIVRLGFDFVDVKEMFKEILKQDKNGFIIISIKREDLLEGGPDISDDIFLYNTRNDIKIGEIKGKILVINFIDSEEAISWPYNRTFKSLNLSIQDNNEACVEDKVKFVKDFLEGDNEGYIKINFLTIQTNIYLSVNYLARRLQKRIFDKELLKGKKGFIHVFDYIDLLSFDSLLIDMNLPIV